MTVYTNNQGDGLWIVFKFDPEDGDLNTNSHNGSYARKPPARTYNKQGPAKAQWNRYIKDGYRSRVATIDANESLIIIRWCDEDWVPTAVRCRHSDRSGRYGRRIECQRRKDHDGIHWSGIEAKRDPDYDPVAAARA
jgi:hypothetical protein